MQTEEYRDGSIHSRIIVKEQELAESAIAAMRNPDVRAVTQTKLENLPDDYPCPCRSGMKYGRCCKKKVQG